jgi:hypothetical protein
MASRGKQREKRGKSSLTDALLFLLLLLLLEKRRQNPLLRLR